MSENKIKILIADDTPYFREYLRMALPEIEGVQVVGEVTNGLEAISKVKEVEPDIIFMDIFMPVLDGIQATSIIQIPWPPIHVISFSSSKDEHLKRKMMEAGASDYLFKFSRFDEIEKSIKNVLQVDSHNN